MDNGKASAWNVDQLRTPLTKSLELELELELELKLNPHRVRGKLSTIVLPSSLNFAMRYTAS